MQEELWREFLDREPQWRCRKLADFAVIEEELQRIRKKRAEWAAKIEEMTDGQDQARHRRKR